MNEQMGLIEFFAMEAADYLERIDGLLSGSTEPDGGEFVRLTRALRGSALMANQRGIGAASEAFENLARAFKDRRIEWNEAIKQTAIRALDDLKILVRSVGQGGEAEDAQAAKLAATLKPQPVVQFQMSRRKTRPVLIPAPGRSSRGKALRSPVL